MPVLDRSLLVFPCIYLKKHIETPSDLISGVVHVIR